MLTVLYGMAAQIIKASFIGALAYRLKLFAETD